jgi:hypothetical protein
MKPRHGWNRVGIAVTAGLVLGCIFVIYTIAPRRIGYGETTLAVACILILAAIIERRTARVHSFLAAACLVVTHVLMKYGHALRKRVRTDDHSQQHEDADAHSQKREH